MPVSRQMPVAALLSAYTRRPAENPRSRAMGAVPTPSAAPFHDARQLGLPRGQRDRLLRGGPVLDRAHPTHANPSARRSPSAQAPNKVSVHGRADRSPPSSRYGKL
eukprot:10542736-Alexandrium_andersonii.AAC.1